MQRGPSLLVFAVVAMMMGCPDPCVFTRAACLVDSDCGDGELCRLDREFEDRCSVVKGACIAIVDDPLGPPCGSVADCADAACCDPVRNACVAAALYPGPDVDDLTCRTKDNTQIAETCLTDADCPVEADVDDAYDCVASVGEAGLCLAPCDNARPCFDDGVCTNGHCFFRLGTPCEDGTNVDARHCGDAALDVCETLDVNLDETSGYCTRPCDDERPCPAGFLCDFPLRRDRRPVRRPDLSTSLNDDCGLRNAQGPGRRRPDPCRPHRTRRFSRGPGPAAAGHA